MASNEIRRFTAALAVAATLTVFSSAASQGQAAAPGEKTSAPAQAATPAPAASPLPPSAADQQEQRKKDLADDTAKLLQLAKELKAEVDKSTKDTLSLTVIKKAAEVEKLAHKVRDEMKMVGD